MLTLENSHLIDDETFDDDYTSKELVPVVKKKNINLIR